VIILALADFKSLQEEREREREREGERERERKLLMVASTSSPTINQDFLKNSENHPAQAFYHSS